MSVQESNEYQNRAGNRVWGTGNLLMVLLYCSCHICFRPCVQPLAPMWPPFSVLVLYILLLQSQMWLWRLLLSMSTHSEHKTMKLNEQFSETNINLVSTWHKGTDVFMVGADIWFLKALNMVGIETFSTFNPQIIINVSVNAILYQKLIFKMHGWLSQIMANETAPVEVFSLLGLLPIRNLGHNECRI